MRGTSREIIDIFRVSTDQLQSHKYSPLDDELWRERGGEAEALTEKEEVCARQRAKIYFIIPIGKL